MNLGIALIAFTRRDVSFFAALTALALGGCTAAGLVAGAGASASTAALQERGLAGAAQDIAIYARVNALLIDDNLALFSKVSIEVVEGRVLLTGVVPDTNARIRAVQVAWRAEGVREMINEIIVDKPDGVNSAQDVWITARLVGRLKFDQDISSINYSVDVVRGVVYLMGVAQDQAELDRVLRHARDVGFVRRIVNYVRLRTDPSRQR